MPSTLDHKQKKYCFFMTGNDAWLKLAKDLYDEGIATPILWLGDDRLYEGAKELFDDSVVRMLDFVHRPMDITNVGYSGEYSEFLETSDYLDVKDICLKMMDRLDLNGSFSRIDRESYFHKLMLWALKFFHDNKPDALLMIEKPHSHAQYVIYRIARYLNIPAAHFKDCALMPVNFLQKVDGSYVVSNYKIDDYLINKFEKVINDYVNKLTALRNLESSYSPHYMIAQKNNSRLQNRLKSLLGTQGRVMLRDFASDIRFFFNKAYQATNPYRFFFITRFLIKKIRQKNLREAIFSSQESINFEKDYFYFPLHYEPERTTNPDGEAYHDQFKSLVLLRKFIPENIEIVVKEHPSQFLMADRGSRGRSPLFYKLIKNIEGVSIVSPDVDSFKLMRQSIGVATITGSVALEAALLKKPSIVFGKAWYEGCPNTHSWGHLKSFESLMNSPLSDANAIKKFLLDLVKSFGIPMVNNISQLKAYQDKWYDENFILSQYEGMRALILEFFKLTK